MQELCFSLEEIKDFISIGESEISRTSLVKNKTEMKTTETQQKIQDLNKVLKALDKFAACCGENVAKESCELLVCFESDWDCCCMTDACKCDEVCNCGDCCKESGCC